MYRGRMPECPGFGIFVSDPPSVSDCPDPEDVNPNRPVKGRLEDRIQNLQT